MFDMLISAIAKLKTAVGTCSKSATFEHGHNVCSEARNVWDAFEYAILSDPMSVDLALAAQAAQLLQSGSVSLDNIPAPRGITEKKRLKGFKHSVSARQKDIDVLAREGVEAFRTRTILYALAVA